MGFIEQVKEAKNHRQLGSGFAKDLQKTNKLCNKHELCRTASD
jgi:hypothetical protein